MTSTSALWRSGYVTDPGRQRTRNEDRIFCDQAEGIFLVVDGVGGHAAGETAAEVAVETIVAELRAYSGDDRDRVRRAVTIANNTIYTRARESPDCAGMACVLTLVVMRENTLTFGHVGDSRLYLVWNGTLRKLTSDHSPVGEQEDNGELTETEAMLHPRRNEVFRGVGSRERSLEDPDFVEVRTVAFHPAAALLLCSDGLSDALTTGEMVDVIEQYAGEPEPIAQMLVQAANEQGGTDNVSVIFVAGEEFVGAHSPSMRDARTRHAITRTRLGRGLWQAYRARLLWLAIGMLIGMILWGAGQRWLPVMGAWR